MFGELDHAGFIQNAAFVASVQAECFFASPAEVPQNRCERDSSS